MVAGLHREAMIGISGQEIGFRHAVEGRQNDFGFEVQGGKVLPHRGGQRLDIDGVVVPGRQLPRLRRPGPAAVARLLGADIGRMTLYGLLMAIPMTVVGGIWYPAWIGRRIFVAPPEHLLAQQAVSSRRREPTVWLVLAVILLPILLIGMASLFPGIGWIAFVGSVPVSLLLAAIAALFALGRYSGLPIEEVLRHTGESLNSVGSLIMIVGASGAVKQIIVDCGAGAFDRLSRGRRIAHRVGIGHRRHRHGGRHRGADRRRISGNRSSADGHRRNYGRVHLLPRERRRILDGSGILRHGCEADHSGVLGDEGRHVRRGPGYAVVA